MCMLCAPPPLSPQMSAPMPDLVPSLVYGWMQVRKHLYSVLATKNPHLMSSVQRAALVLDGLQDR